MMAETIACAEFTPALELYAVSETDRHSGTHSYPYARKTFGLIQVLSGSAVYEFDGIPYPVKAGDVFCIPQDRPFALRPIEKTSYHTRQFGLMIHDPVLDSRMRQLYPPLTVDTTLNTMLDYIFRFWNIPTPQNKLLLDTFLRTIFTQFFIGEINYDNPVSAYVLTDGYSPATKKAICYVEANRNTRFSLEKMGQLLGYNKHYLCTAFSQDTGISILSYVHFQKIRQAIVHFFYWGIPLTEVCELLCFDSPSHFSTLFKSLVGISPGAFRKACLALNAEERTKINRSMPLLISHPAPIEDLFSGMRQFGAVMADVLQRL